MTMSVTDLSPDVRDAATAFLLAIADDEFVAGHRFTDWVAVGPTMEEDNALASIAQDELGHARLWYEYVADALDGDLDDLALNRPASERRNTVLVESPHEDFAAAIAVNVLYDAAEVLFLEALHDGDVAEIAARAAQALNEEAFHREHADLWLDRLTATEEGRARLTAAFQEAIPRAADLFAFDADRSEALVEGGVLARPVSDLAVDWAATVRADLDGSPLPLDETLEGIEPEGAPAQNGRRGEHTPALESLVTQLHPDNVVGDHPINRYQP